MKRLHHGESVFLSAPIFSVLTFWCPHQRLLLWKVNGRNRAIFLNKKALAKNL